MKKIGNTIIQQAIPSIENKIVSKKKANMGSADIATAAIFVLTFSNLVKKTVKKPTAYGINIKNDMDITLKSSFNVLIPNIPLTTNAKNRAIIKPERINLSLLISICL
ncbi:hypothetical protein [Mucilaginibacter sp.]|uniref:hypothetical protein n=1 Tax=Mucilaginibacter sp. TaxID=1882438 RepID=UPI0035BC552B